MTAHVAVPDPARFDEVSPEDLPKLIALALVLDQSRRVARFGAAVADATIRRHYLGLDFARYLAWGAFVRGRLEAVVEMYALDDAWGRAEICALGLPRAQARWAAVLANEAWAQASARQCRELVWIEVGADGWSPALTAARRDAWPRITTLCAR